MNITPTPLTAALAGIGTALAWPFVWSRFGGAGTDGGVALIVAALLVFALPAHAFVIGFGPAQRGSERGLDRALLKRIGAWLAAAAATALLLAAIRS
ncbi:hypothetical protein [Aquabacterium sp.]|uniref:hypothetical protein n=1 Tax=Aquabacterium sp. TaxID=1872578 RepID=UPI003783E13E